MFVPSQDALHPEVAAEPSCPSHRAIPRAEIEQALKHCNQPTLEAMLRVVQLRLGTPGECLGDLDYAQMIAHQVNNLLTAQRLAEALRRLDEP